MQSTCDAADNQLFRLEDIGGGFLVGAFFLIHALNKYEQKFYACSFGVQPKFNFKINSSHFGFQE